MAVPSPDPLTYAPMKMRPLPHLTVMSRWLQLPLYLGLIVAVVLLCTVISAPADDKKTLLWQTAIPITFLLSALAIAGVDRPMPAGATRRAEH